MFATGYVKWIVQLRHKIIFDTGVNAAFSFASLVAYLLLSASLVRGLAPVELGAWAMILLLTMGRGYLSIIDLGVTVTALARLAVATKEARPTDQTSELIAHLKSHFQRVSIVGGGAIFAFGYTLWVAADAPYDRSKLLKILVLLSVRLLFDCRIAVHLIIIEANSRFLLLRSCQLFELGLWTAAATLIVSKFPDVLSLAIGYTIISIISLGVTALASNRVIRSSNIRPRWSSFISEELVQGNRWVTLQRFMSLVYTHMDRTLLTLFVGLGAVAIYEVPARASALSVMVLSLFPSALFPVTARLAAARNDSDQARLFKHATQVTVGLSIPFIVGTIIAMPVLLELLFGTEFTGSTGASRLFMVWPLLASFHVVSTTMLTAAGYLKEMSIFASVSTVVNLTVSLALVSRFGVNGVIVGTIAGYAVVFIPQLILELRSFITGLEWLRQIMVPTVIGVLAQLGFVFVGLKFVQNSNWLAYLFVVGISMIVSVLTFTVLAVPISKIRQAVEISGLKSAVGLGGDQE